MGFIMLIGLGSIIFLVPLLINSTTNKVSKRERAKLEGVLYKLDIIICVSLTIWTIWLLPSIKIFGFVGLFIISIIGLLSLLAYAPLMKMAGIKFQLRPIRYAVSICTYFFLSIGIVPLLNYFIVFLALNPIFGFERKVIFSNSKYLYERQHSVVSSGGSFVYVLYDRNLFYDRVKKEYYGQESKYEDPKFINSIK